VPGDTQFGFFVAAIGVGLIFHSVTEAIQTYLLAKCTNEKR